MTAIVLCDAKNGIAKDGKQITFIPEDLKYFAAVTSGKTVIMGRKTYEALPGKKPLKNRRNIILSRSLTGVEGFDVYHDVSEMLSHMSDEEATRNCYVIGGEQIYKLLFPFCDKLLVTRIHYDYHADQFFPEISRNKFSIAPILNIKDSIKYHNGHQWNYEVWKKICTVNYREVIEQCSIDM